MKRTFFMLVIVVTACVERFNPEIEQSHTDLYVVDGSISDVNPAQLLIRKSVGYGSETAENEVVSGASVILYDDTGNQETLLDHGKGHYASTTPGQVGRSYFIEIQLPDGSVIASKPELLKPGASVGTLSKTEGIRYKISSAGVNLPIYGLEVNLYMDETDTLSSFYRWTFIQTYEVHTPLDPTAPPCYITEQIPFSFVLGESVTSKKDLLSENLQFFTDDDKFVFGYSLEVIQHAISKENYDYWKKIEDQQKNVGSIFDAPPAQIEGNLSFVDQKNIPVLGYFEVASIKKKRIYIEPTDFRIKPEPNWIPCFPPPALLPYVRIPDWCSDCTAHNNSSRDVPPFWPN